MNTERTMPTASEIETGIAHASFTLAREYAAPVEKVFAAFSEKEKKRRWYVDDVHTGMEILEYSLDFRVGGRERTRFRTTAESPLRGAEVTNETVYMDIVEHERITIAYTMAVGEYRISASLATFALMKTATGTRLVMTDQSAFFPNSDGVELRREGWTKILEALTREIHRELAQG